LFYEKLHDFPYPPDMIPVMKQRRMVCEGHVAFVRRREIRTGFW